MLELLIVALVMAVLMAQAWPSYSALLNRVRVSTAAGNFRAALAAARSAAIRRGQRVDLLPASTAGWQSGWKVVIDLNNNQQVDPDEPVLHTEPALPPGVEIVASLTDTKRAYLAFDPSGRPRSAGSATQPQFGSLLFRAGRERRKLVIGFLGRVRLCDPDRDRLPC